METKQGNPCIAPGLSSLLDRCAPSSSIDRRHTHHECAPLHEPPHGHTATNLVLLIQLKAVFFEPCRHHVNEKTVLTRCGFFDGACATWWRRCRFFGRRPRRTLPARAFREGWRGRHHARPRARTRDRGPKSKIKEPWRCNGQGDA